MNLKPISIVQNSQQNCRPLSPINLLTEKRKFCEYAITIKNQQLKSTIVDLKFQLKSQKQKTCILKVEQQEQKQKISFWMRSFLQIQQKCLQKQQTIKSSVNKSKNMNNNKSFKIYDNIIKQNPKRMAQDNQQETNYASFNQSVQLNNYKKQFTKISSVLAEKKRNKKRQALSLTHLHRYPKNQIISY